MRGTLPGQRSVQATLATIAEAAAGAGIGAPAVTVVGPVAALAGELDWLTQARPLSGHTVAVTRARAQAGTLATRLRALGAAVAETPAIRIEALDAAIPDLGGLRPAVRHEPQRRRAPARGRARRPGTGRPADRCGRPGHRTGPARARHRGRRRATAGGGRVARRGARVGAGAPCARRARRGGPRRAVRRAAGTRRARSRRWRSTARCARRSTTARARAALGADYLTFASASAVRFFQEAAGSLYGPRLVSIGPVTSAELRRLGAEPDVEAA